MRQGRDIRLPIRGVREQGAGSEHWLPESDRFRSGRHDAFKVDLGDDWVAFRSPSEVANPVKPIQLPDSDLPPLPLSRIGKITRCEKIDERSGALLGDAGH